MKSFNITVKNNNPYKPELNGSHVVTINCKFLIDNNETSAKCDALEMFGDYSEIVSCVELSPVDSIKSGEYVRKIGKNGMQNKTYVRGAYCGKIGYELSDCDDMNRTVFVKKGAMLAVGFTY